MPHPLLWAGSWAACGKIAIRGMLNRLNYYAIFIVYIYNLQKWRRPASCNLAGRIRPAGRGFKAHGLGVMLLFMNWCVNAYLRVCARVGACFLAFSTVHNTEYF
jgi:hypothetical protein